MTTVTTDSIPAILSGHALRSLRESGYTLPAALGEVIDNAIEADANEIDVYFEETEEGKRKAHISRIAVADDGTGMGADQDGRDILHHYLQLGYSTRYMSTTTIGKFGVGAKLGALSFARRIDVWSRTDGESDWRHVHFDLDEAIEAEERSELVLIGEPDSDPVPDEFEFLLPEGSGTLVLWSKVDRLEHGRWAEDANKLRVDVERELARIFRYQLNGGIGIRIGEEPLLAHDPLMLMERTWADKALEQEARKQSQEEAKQADERGDKAPKAKPATHFEATVIGRSKLKIGGHSADLTVTLYPPEVTRKRYLGGDTLAKRLRVPENQGRISFVRMKREINYATVPYSFPTGVLEPDRFIGIEVSFTPELDEYFGVRNVKRGVEPHGDLRKQLKDKLAPFVEEARAERERRWGEAARESQETEGEHRDIVDAVDRANKRLPKSRAKDEPKPDSEEQAPSGDQALEDLATDVGKDEPGEREEYIEGIRGKAIVVESVDYPGQSFVDIQHVAGQVIIRLNTRHRFYRELFQPIKAISEQEPGTVSSVEAVKTARRTREALTLLLMAYGKAESMNENPRDAYGELRNYWGTFLDSLMGDVKEVI
jgi:hypothetical protein